MQVATLSALACILTLTGCPDPDPVDPDAGDYKDQPFQVWVADASANAVCVDSAGMVYATGMTTASGQGKGDVLRPGYPGGEAGYVVKIAPDGSVLRFTYLGGERTEGYAIAATDDGVIVGGATNDQSFPAKNAYQSAYHPGSSGNCFITYLGKDLKTIRYSTFIGGGSQHAGDSNDGSAVKTIRANPKTGEAVFLASSQDMDFPLGENGRCMIGRANSVGYDIYEMPYTYGYNLPPCWARVIIGRITRDGEYRGINVGGYEPDTTSGPLALGSDGSVYLGARCKSGGPLLWATTPGSYRTSIYQQGQTYFDGCAAKLSPSGSSLAYSTFIGGHAQNDMMAGCVDSAGQFILAGRTKASDYPVTSDAFQNKNNGSYDWTITRFNSAGSALVFSTYLGGSNGDAPSGIALDSQGRAWVCGYGGGGGFTSGAVVARLDFCTKTLDLIPLSGQDATDICLSSSHAILAITDGDSGQIRKLAQ